MPSPWDDRQKPNERSADHGKRDKDHGPHEHGGGALPPDPAAEPTPAGTVEDFLRDAGESAELVAAASIPDDDIAAGALDFAGRYRIPNVPPARNQGTKPQCVAYSHGYGQAHIDRPEAGRFLDFDEDKFHRQIGGTSAGASQTRALEQRRDHGFPVANLGHRRRHRIKRFYVVSLGINAIKAAIVAAPRNGEVNIIGPYYHSWMHPLASGKLPAPDYVVFGHDLFYIGWDDDLGFEFLQSWGSDWGKNGHGFMPYSFIARMWAVRRTYDRT